MNKNNSYFESVKKIYKDLSVDELIIEYFWDDFNDLMEETKIIIEEIFKESNITISEAALKYRELLKIKSSIDNVTNDKSLMKVIGTRRFYMDWISYKNVCLEYGLEGKNINCVEYYEMIFRQITEEEKIEIQQLDDELQTAIRYGKYKSKK